MIVKLTDADGKTRGETQWGPGVSNKAISEGNGLCSPGVIHYYKDEWLAVFANPIHSAFRNPQMWEFVPENVVADDGMKCGCKRGTTVRQVPVPEMTAEQHAEIAIRYVMPGCKNAIWVSWAEKWLSGEDRTASAADAAYWAATAVEVGKGGDKTKLIHEVMEKKV